MKRMRFLKRNRISAIVVAVFAVVGLAACDAIPSSGPVRAGLPDLEQSEQQVLFASSGPMIGASQEEIARGFVAAAASNVDDYAIAREFLTPEYASQWDPYAEALIDEGPREYSQQGEGIGELELTAIASVNSRGEMQPVPPGQPTEVRYEFTEVDGEWRISSAPTGIVIDRATFTAAWSTHQLYFLGAEGVLVPETRWFLSRASTATQIVLELLAGPSEQMLDVVHSAFPPETSLVSNSAPVIDGTARIELSGGLQSASDAVIDDIVRQLAASLQAVAGVSKFRLVSEGSVIAEAPVGRPEENLTTGSKGTAVQQNGVFGLLVAGEVSELGPISEAIVSLNPTTVTLAGNLGSAVVQNRTGLSWVDGGNISAIDDASSRIAPSRDRFGYVWITRPGSDTLTVIEPGVEEISIAAPWLNGQTPRAIRVSPDGSRIAALVTASGGRSAVLMAGVVRDEASRPLRTTETAPTQLWVDGAPLDFDWVDQSRFATLTDTGASSKVTVGWKGSFPSEAGSVPGGVQLSGGGTRTMLRVLDADGNLYSPQGSGWQRQTDGVQVLAKRG